MFEFFSHLLYARQAFTRCSSDSTLTELSCICVSSDSSDSNPESARHRRVPRAHQAAASQRARVIDIAHHLMIKPCPRLVSSAQLSGGPDVPVSEGATINFFGSLRRRAPPSTTVLHQLTDRAHPLSLATPLHRSSVEHLAQQPSGVKVQQLGIVHGRHERHACTMGMIQMTPSLRVCKPPFCWWESGRPVDDARDSGSMALLV